MNLPLRPLLLVLDYASDKREERIGRTAANIVARLELRTSLANQNRASDTVSPPNRLTPSRCASSSRVHSANCLLPFCVP